MDFERIFEHPIVIQENMIFLNFEGDTLQKNQTQTQDSFSEKWTQFEQGEKKEEVYSFQKDSLTSIIYKVEIHPNVNI
jgi:hypothetical protein